MTHLAVIPSIYSPWTEQCVDSCQIDPLVVVDNTVTNRGVAASWNIGIKEASKQGADWVILLSAAVRFGKAGGFDFVDALANHANAWACESNLVGWHLVAINRRTIEAVGLFDENFYPAYFEDNDYSRRLTLWLQERGDIQHQCTHCGTTDISRHHSPDCLDPPSGEQIHPQWPVIAVDAEDAGTAHGVQWGQVQDDPSKTLNYYARKWGGPRGNETFSRPFGDLTNKLDYWPTP